MPLPLSGQLSMNNIRGELGIPTQAPFALDTATNGGYVTLNVCSPYLPNPVNPDAISEWYGYCHTCSCTPSITPTISVTPSITPSVTRTPSITPTPSLALGECWQITNSSTTDYLCVTYIFRDGTSTFTNLGPAGSGGETSTICIKPNTGNSILGTYTGGSPGSCSGGSDIVIKTYLGYSCVNAGSCVAVSATPSITPSITRTPSVSVTPSTTPPATPSVTPTTPENIYYAFADRYVCNFLSNECTYDGSECIARYNTDFTFGNWYTSGSGALATYAYQVTQLNYTPGACFIVDNEYTSCPLNCFGGV